MGGFFVFGIGNATPIFAYGKDFDGGLLCLDRMQDDIGQEPFFLFVFMVGGIKTGPFFLQKGAYMGIKSPCVHGTLLVEQRRGAIFCDMGVSSIWVRNPSLSVWQTPRETCPASESVSCRV